MKSTLTVNFQKLTAEVTNGNVVMSIGRYNGQQKPVYTVQTVHTGRSKCFDNVIAAMEMFTMMTEAADNDAMMYYDENQAIQTDFYAFCILVERANGER